MKLWNDFKQKTQKMTQKEKTEYVITYYWYYMLLASAMIFLIVFIPVHFLTLKNSRPEFQIAFVNQNISKEETETLKQSFSQYADLSRGKVVFDASYVFSEDNIETDRFELSNYEKFFFQWDNGELDAVIMPESFLKFCIEAGGEFRDLDEYSIGVNMGYFINDVLCGIYVKDTKMFSGFGETGSTAVLVFPCTGKNTENIKKFLTFILE